MPDIRFVEKKCTYRGRGQVFTKPGVYPVDEELARYLLASFPQWFEPVDGTSSDQDAGSQNAGQDSSKADKANLSDAKDSGDSTEQDETTESGDESTDEQTPAKPVTKMNRTELEAEAKRIGLEITADMDTNKKLVEAIKAHQEG